MQTLLPCSPNLTACSSHAAGLQRNSLFRISSAETCPLLWLYFVLLQLCFPVLLTLRNWVVCFSPKYNSACFTSGDVFLSMGIILSGPECLHPHGCEGELGIRCVSLSPLNVMLRQPSESANKAGQPLFTRHRAIRKTVAPVHQSIDQGQNVQLKTIPEDLP